MDALVAKSGEGEGGREGDPEHRILSFLTLEEAPLRFKGAILWAAFLELRRGSEKGDTSLGYPQALTSRWRIRYSHSSGHVIACNRAEHLHQHLFDAAGRKSPQSFFQLRVLNGGEQNTHPCSLCAGRCYCSSPGGPVVSAGSEQMQNPFLRVCFSSLDTPGPWPLPLPIRLNMLQLLLVLPLGLELGHCQALGDQKASPLGVWQAGRGQGHFNHLM